MHQPEHGGSKPMASIGLPLRLAQPTASSISGTTLCPRLLFCELAEQTRVLAFGLPIHLHNLREREHADDAFSGGHALGFQHRSPAYMTGGEFFKRGIQRFFWMQGLDLSIHKIRYCAL